MTYETLLFSVENDIATVTLNRPEVMNGLNGQMRAELAHAIDRAGEEARVLVLRGAGDAFCAGQDLGAGRNMAQLDVERLLRDEYEPMIRALTDCPIPTVAAVHATAAGAGANLALCADIVVASERAVFIQAFTRIGLMPDAGGTYWLPRQVGFARAMGAALLAEPVTAAQAESWGMIWKSFADDAFEDGVADIVTRLANGPTEAYRHTKNALRASFDNDWDSQLELEAHHQGVAAKTLDFAEGINAFLEKRPANFKGA